MITAIEGSPVARTGHGGEREGAGRPKSPRDDVSVKIDRAVVAKMQYVARLKGLTLAEFATETLRPIIDKEFARTSKELGEG
jgi:hypothetical protein